MTAERVVRLAGDVDLASQDTVMELLDEGARHLDAGDTLVVDLSAVTFLDSTGLCCVVTASTRAEALGARLVLRQAPPMVVRVLEITGLLGFLDSTP